MKIFGIEMSKLKYTNFLKEITENNKDNSQKIIFTPNPEILLDSLTDDNFKQNLLKADYLTPDGIGLYLAYQILDNKHNKFINFLLLPYYILKLFLATDSLYNKYGDRICGSDLTNDLLDYAEKNSLEIAILDLYNPTDKNKVESQKTLIEKLNKKFKNIKFNLIIYRNNNDEVIKILNNQNNFALLATLGGKKQEQAIIDILPHTKISLGLGIGSSIDYQIGFQRRAPKLMRSLGLEWLYRLIMGPQKIKRLKRIYNATFRFIYNIFRSK
ncbi:MAG: WecB/TagA/CpsF family glycosyltransferase [Candidatus Gracilibacteria bacterium]|nr:WecB/TagA/CpsF family glycosyltransferase [Candidatus Gracilibacteria bacterium]